MKMRAIWPGFFAVLLAGAVACAPKAPPKPKTPPKPPAPQLGQGCTPSGPWAQGDCATGLSCVTAGGASFCASACPCAGGVLCAETPSAPEMCLKPCSSDADCGRGLACNADYKACAPAGMLVSKPPVCSQPALGKKAFSKAAPLSSGTAGGASHDPAIAFDKNGNLVAVYTGGALTAKLYSSHATIVGGEVTPGEIDHELAFDRENAGYPWLAADRGGRLFMTYVGWNGGIAETGMTIGVATSDDGVSWSKPVAAFDAATDCPGDAPGCLHKPTIAIGPDRDKPKSDVVYVLYHSAATNSLRATHSVDGGQTFSASAQVGAGGRFADADVTSSGKLHVVYVGGGGNPMGDAGNGVYYTSSADGGESFAAPVRVSGEGEAVPFYLGSPRVVVDVPRKMLYAVYTAGTPDGKWDIMLASSKDGGVTWSRLKVNDDDACATHMLPAAALDPNTGRIHVAWLDNRTGAGGVAYASCASEGRSCGKNEAVSDAPFATFGYGRHSSHALGDAIALVYDARHKMLHALWAQPVDEGGKTTARIMHASARPR